MADGQVETQPTSALPESYNPHDAVAHFEAMLSKQDTPRDEKGKFAKTETKTEAAQPETEAPEAKAEETVEAPALEEQEPEAQPEPRKLKLKYKGEDKEVDEAEAVELAQKGYDYTQKSQALAKEREELAAKVKAETEAAYKKYQDQLEVHKRAVLSLADPEAMNADLDKLSIEDPAKALQLMLKRQKIIGSLNNIHAEQQRIAQQAEVEAQSTRHKQAQEALEIIQRDIPNWNQETYGKILKSAVDNGYTQQEANAITDPKVVKLLNKARQWDEYVAAKPKTMDKRVAAVPKVQKPGSAEKADPKAGKLKDGMARLSKTGSRTDAQDYALALIESGRL